MKKMNSVQATLVGMLTRMFTSKDYDNMIFANQLSTAVKSSVEKNFPNLSVAYAAKNGAKYDLTLNDGTEVTMFRDGTVEKVERQNGAVPNSLVPGMVADVVENYFGKKQIQKLMKTPKGYFVQLSNAKSFSLDNSGCFA